MRDLIGEKKALEQTQQIIQKINHRELPKKMYKEVVRSIYDNQLKKWTDLNRSERHKRLKGLEFNDD